MKTFFVVLAAILFPYIVISQSGNHDKIDSLELELKQVQHDTSKVNILCELARYYGKIDSTKTFQSAFEALALSEKIDYPKGVAYSLISIGSGYMDYFEIEKAEEYLKKGIDQTNILVAKDSSKANLKLWLKGHYFLAINHSYKDELDEQIALTDMVIPVAEQIKDYEFLGNLYTNNAIMQMNLGRREDAYASFTKSGDFNRKVGKPEKIIFDRLTFSSLLYQMDSVHRMPIALEEAKSLLDKDPKALDWHLYHTEVGMYNAGMGNYEKAILSLDQAKAIVTKNKMYQELFLLLQKYAFINERRGDFKTAGSYMTEFLNTAIQNKNGINTFQGYYKRSQYLAAGGEYKGAYNDLFAALRIYDSLETVETIKNAKELELKYESLEKEKEILALKVTNEEKKSQAYLLGILASVLALLLFGGYYVYNQRMRKARKKERLQEAEVNLLKQEQQNKIFSAMIEGQEKERKRLAIDLHDGLGGRLSGISMNLSKLDKDEPKEYPKKQLQKVMKDLDDSLTELRAIARNMMPETLMKFGLQAALKDYCSSMTTSDTKVMLQVYGADKDIDINQQVTIYRVIQELINNAVKHAKASEILVQFMREGDQVDITVEDNGVGFIKNENPNTTNSGMGLSNLETRVAYLKGNIEFESEENEGTTVNVHLNINAA